MILKMVKELFILSAEQLWIHVLSTLWRAEHCDVMPYIGCNDDSYVRLYAR